MKRFQISNLRFQIPKFVICISLLLISHFSLLTSLSAEEKIEIEEVVVTATRIEEAIEETTSDVVVIKAEDIKKMNIQFVTDVLRKIPELNLIQSGGAGKLATILLRGGDSKHTLVMIDGVKIKSTTTGSFDFSGINVDDIERIEIVKGPQSTLYGSEAMAGVINIITKKGEGKPKIDVSFESGSYGMYKPSLTVSGGNKKLDYRLTGTYFYTDGISAAKEGTEKDGYKNASISGKFGFRPVERLELELSGKYYYDRSELDFGTSGADDPNYTQRGNHYILSGKGKFYLVNIWEQILTISTVKDILKSRDPDDLFGWYSSDITTGIDTIDWQHNFYFSDNYTFTGGVEYRKEKGKSVELPTEVLRFDKAVDNKALYLNNKLKFLNDDLIINAGLRYDDHETFGAKTTYKLGAMYDIKPAGLRLRSSYGTGFRAPTLNELFWPDVGWYKGNPNLKPEETNSWDVTMEKEIIKDKISLSLTYFDQRYKNLVTGWYPPINIAKAEIKGIEVNAALKVTDNINIKGGYTYLDTEDKATGERLPLGPKDKFNLSTEFSTKDMSVIADYTFVSERYDSSVSRNLSSYSLLNLSSSYKMTKGLTIFARVENLLDEDYEEAGGYGTPGLSIFGGIRISL
ncbi:MAG: TonB-dependent receptor [Nitrospirae bacterium]|nr:TonB-dependent receptor [Nitrospirota bacterium]